MDGQDIPLIIINDVLFMWDIFNVFCNMITHLERSLMGYFIFFRNKCIDSFYRDLYLIALLICIYNYFIN